jgi:hypothetical protein
MSMEFAASMTEDEVTTGELFHLEEEKKRRIVMIAGLTKSSSQLRDSCNTNQEAFQHLLSMGASAIQHYENVLELLNRSMARLNAIENEKNASLK